VTGPLINILIRNKYRPQEFERCINSVLKQEYKNWRVIIASDSDRGKEQADSYVEERGRWIESYGLSVSQHVLYELPCYYNLYLNEMMQLVTDGYMLALDNDDYLIDPQALSRIVPHLTGDGIICQFLRNGRPKPNDRLIRERRIERGRIGGGCLILHSKHKEVAQWDGEKGADYRYIKAVSEKVQLEFVPIVVQVAGNGGLNGK
jgi:glycosyltransferase involved in cell wall biosynthesis